MRFSKQLQTVRDGTIRKPLKIDGKAT